MRIFNQFVHIDRNDEVEAAAQRLIDEQIPRRRIRRRHSTMLGEVIPEAGNEPDEQRELVAPRKKRRESMDARIYVAPPEIRSAIQTLRQSPSGVLNYQSSFHSVRQRQTHIAAIGAISEPSSSSNLSGHTTALMTDDDDDINDINGTEAVSIEAISEPSSSSNSSVPTKALMTDDVDDATNVTESAVDKGASSGVPSLAQMEENLRRLRENLGKFFLFCSKKLMIRLE